MQAERVMVFEHQQAAWLAKVGRHEGELPLQAAQGLRSVIDSSLQIRLEG